MSPEICSDWIRGTSRDPQMEFSGFSGGWCMLLYKGVLVLGPRA